MKNIEVKFPLIEDITMEIAKKYGMLQPEERKTQAVRAVFLVDPKGGNQSYYLLSAELGTQF
jgi:peroxiredoxin (alkyl hydroperoxide reductase subunit C)